MPFSVPATLKSISPRWSSSPKISVKIAYELSSSRIKPIATPATGAFSGTPASIIEREPPQTDAMDEEPFDSVISETTRIVYGKSVAAGKTACNALQASFPWPISLRPGEPTLPTSPTEYGGKL